MPCRKYSSIPHTAGKSDLVEIVEYMDAAPSTVSQDDLAIGQSDMPIFIDESLDTNLDFIEGIGGEKTLVVEPDQLLPIVEVVEQLSYRLFLVDPVVLFPEGVGAKWGQP